MTIREIAIKAMQELGFPEGKIASNLAFMDTAEPHMLDKIEEQVLPELESEMMEISKRFFRKYQENPLNN